MVHVFYFLTTIIYVKQVIWGGRWQDGSACSTGEEVEQINSHMSRCGNTTKYMLPESKLKLKPVTECEY